MRTWLCLAVVALSACSPPQPPPPPAPPPPPLSSAAAQALLRTYVAGLDEFDAPRLENRFRRLGSARVVETLPDTAWCHYYFASVDATQCYRAQYEEPFRIRTLRPLEGRATAPLVRIALEERYPGAARLAFILEEVMAGDLVCASFFVRQTLGVIDSATTFLNFPYEQRGLVLDGMACDNAGARAAIVDEPEYDGAGFLLWDAFRRDGRQYLVVAREGDEIGWLELYRLQGRELVLVTALTSEDIVVEPAADEDPSP